MRSLEAEIKALSETRREAHPDLVVRRRQLEDLRARVAELSRQVQEARRGPFTREPQAVAVRKPAIPEMPLIDTTFMMRLGETVIVGTSRVGGDKALIAVLTAVGSKRE